MDLAPTRPRPSLAEIEAAHRDFHKERDRLFRCLIDHRPDDVGRALDKLQTEIQTKGLREAMPFEKHFIEEAPKRVIRGIRGGFAKGDAYEQARAYVAGLHETWTYDSEQYRSISEFCKDASQRLAAAHGMRVETSTIGKWLKQAKLRRPPRKARRRPR